MKVHIEFDPANSADAALAAAIMHMHVEANHQLKNPATKKIYDIIDQKGGTVTEPDLALLGLRGHAWTLMHHFGLLKKSAAGFSRPRDLELSQEAREKSEDPA